MKIHTFIAASAADAIAQIRATLGPDAVVLDVRRPPVEGLARLWQRPRIEVLAHIPEPTPPALGPDVIAALRDELREELREIRQQVKRQPTDGADPAPSQNTSPPGSPPSGRLIEGPSEGATPSQSFGASSGLPETPCKAASARPAVSGLNGAWRVGSLLENSGVLPMHAERVVEALQAQHGATPPAALAQELDLAALHLANLWREAPAATAGAHVFIGPPGGGKTTALCKWLAQTALVQGVPAQVWRLDGHVANTAESLSVYCEILGVPQERFVPDSVHLHPGEVLFIDVPGVNPSDAAAMTHLAGQIEHLPNPQVHLVLNAAYETSLLLAQARAFASLPVTDLVVTHLDEEARWGKLWNLVLGTNCSLRFLSAGQNIPGNFSAATPAHLLNRQFPRKTTVYAV